MLRIQAGTFRVPRGVSADAADLIRRLLVQVSRKAAAGRALCVRDTLPTADAAAAGSACAPLCDGGARAPLDRQALRPGGVAKVARAANRRAL